MSNLNRKEFIELLFEWNKNFINERGSNIKFQKNKNTTGHLINPPVYEMSGFVEFLKDYIEENNISYLFDILDQNIGHGIVLPKNPETIEIISNFFLYNFNEEKSNEVLATKNDDECVIIQFSSGDFMKSYEEQSQASIYYWTIHDLEHNLLNANTGKDYHFCNAALKLLGKKFNRNKINFYEVLSHHTLLKYFDEIETDIVIKFFKEINFTPSVIDIDINASIMSYCYARMKNEEDFDEIESIDKDKFNMNEINILKSIMNFAYKITDNVFKDLKEKIKQLIIISF